jgi:iron complex outermembrane receptor protein
MINKIFFFVLALLAAFSLNAQSLVKGRIIDQDGAPLGGVNILLYQNQTGTVSQDDGTYQLSIPSYLKVITLEFTYIGYRTQAKTLDLTTDTSKDYTINIQLEKSQLELQEITVTAGFIKQKDEVPYPIETVRKKDIVTIGEGQFYQSHSTYTRCIFHKLWIRRWSTGNSRLDKHKFGYPE